MFKVSFKENPQFPVKKVQRFNDDRVTVVILKGVVKLPKFLQYFIPPKIFDWMETLKNVDAEVTMSRMFIKVTGKSICAEEDTVDKVLGERIAEARAKITLYKFMCKFCIKVTDFFVEQLYGTSFLDIDRMYNINVKDNVDYAMGKYLHLYEKECKHLNILLGHESNTESSQEH